MFSDRSLRCLTRLGIAVGASLIVGAALFGGAAFGEPAHVAGNGQAHRVAKVQRADSLRAMRSREVVDASSSRPRRGARRRVTLGALLHQPTRTTKISGRRYAYVWSAAGWARHTIVFRRTTGCQSLTLTMAYAAPAGASRGSGLATMLVLQRSRTRSVNVPAGAARSLTVRVSASPFEVVLENAPGTAYGNGYAVCVGLGTSGGRTRARVGAAIRGMRDSGGPNQPRLRADAPALPSVTDRRLASVAADPAESAIAWAEKHVGQVYDFDLCQQFVHDAYYQVGVDIGSAGSAAGYWAAHPTAQHPGDTNPPRGALVYWGATKANPDGHVGISLGGGQVISTYSYPQTTTNPDAVHTFSIEARNAANYPYLGWISPPGVNLGASTNSPMTNYLGHIVQWNGDTKAQKTAWLVVMDGGKLRRRWIPDIATYWCLKAHGNPGPDVLTASQLNAMPDELDVWVKCDTADPPGGGGDGSAPSGISEQAGHHGARTFTNYHDASGEGPSVAAGQYAEVACKVHDGNVPSSNPDGYWYQLVGQPWNGAYYAPANSFMNGDPWNGPYTHNTDMTVPDCSGSSSAGAPTNSANVTLWLEQEGHHGANTFANYHNASGEGPAVAAGDYVHVLCKVYDPTVASSNPDGYWYLIADSPWNDVYYAAANTFMNGDPWNGPYTHNTDFGVPDCGSDDTSPPSGSPPPSSGPAAPGATYPETAGGVTHTWSNYTDAGGNEGPSIASSQTVDVTCRVQGFTVSDGNTWWYQIASGPWSGAYYASADAFYNNGETSGSLQGTPFVDSTVPVCGSGSPGGSGGTGSGGGGSGTGSGSPTYAETTGGVTHTWTNYSDAGGTEGPSIPSNDTVQITCRLQGFRVADGNTWWYQIASGPWSNNYYASADAFYNNGETSGSLQGTPFYDPNVPVCG